ncbi:SdpI family protein [Corynebacterium sp. 13CS0277]|uniref:SdpI family protein n=1 Tax=Corynebacterium sp. 13CS0277 TaxID=2071994 RepID=UPI0011B256FC|nr:SdpI family protein [Corynebacterium sp. 13CS0277]
MTILASVLLVLAAIQLVVGILAWTGKLPGNNIIGIRIPEARSSEEMWVLTHRIAGPLWTAAGVALLFAGVLGFTARGWMLLLVMVGVLAWLVFVGMGAGMAANAVALIDASEKNKPSTTPAEQAPSAETPADAADAAPKVSVDNAALLAAAAHLQAPAGMDTGVEMCTPAGCTPADTAAGACEEDDPSKDCGVTGGCGSCALNGSCEGGDAAFAAKGVDLDALQRAATQQD